MLYFLFFENFLIDQSGLFIFNSFYSFGWLLTYSIHDDSVWLLQGYLLKKYMDYKTWSLTAFFFISFF